MPLPWKKAKRTRISQLVADHLHPPKRGGSLVVETGFPTSLIDLFVKNRDRLKKPSKKKRFEVIPDPIPIPSRPSETVVVPPTSEFSDALGTPLSSQPPNSPPVLASSSTAATPSSSSRLPNSRAVLPNAHVSASGYATPQRSASGLFGNEIVVIQESGVVSDGEDGGGGEVVNRNRVFTAILKMFFVVALALGTKKFVVGITLSTFLLLFMEYAGKHLCRLLKPCVDGHNSFQCLVEGVLCFVGIERDKLIIEEDRELKEPIAQEGSKPVVLDCSALIEGNKITTPIQEIQIVQPNSNLGCSRLIDCHINDLIQEIQDKQPISNSVPSTGEIQSGEYEFELKGGEEKWVCEEMGKKEEVMEKQEAYTSIDVDIKSQRSHGGKMRSKIKKFVLKTLRGSKKKRSELKNEASSFDEYSKAVMGEVEEHLEDGERHVLEHDEKSSSLSSGGSGKSSWLSSGRSGDQVEVVDAICRSSEFSRAAMEDSIVREEIGKKTKSSGSGYLVLIVIVLVGLVGGRGLALALILSWYLLLKSAGTQTETCEKLKGSLDEVSISS